MMKKSSHSGAASLSIPALPVLNVSAQELLEEKGTTNHVVNLRIQSTRTSSILFRAVSARAMRLKAGQIHLGGSRLKLMMTFVPFD